MSYQSLALGADGSLAKDQEAKGSRTLMTLGAGLNRAEPSEIDPPSSLTWDSEPLAADLDVVGNIELALEAMSTAPDTAWIAILQDVEPNGAVVDVTGGYLRAGFRSVDEAASRPGAPALPCRNFEAVPVGKPARYRIPLVPNARRFKAGHRVRIYLTSDDQDPKKPALMTFRHASVGTSCLNTITSSSRLLIPIIPAEQEPHS